jgi:hypothetical protein
MVKELKRQTAKQVELKSLNADHPERTLSLETWCGSPHRLGEPVAAIVCSVAFISIDGSLHDSRTHSSVRSSPCACCGDLVARRVQAAGTSYWALLLRRGCNAVAVHGAGG